MFQFSKHFSPEEASATLPLVKRIVEDILEAGRTLKTLKHTHKSRN